MRAEPRETSDRELCFVFVPPTNSIENGGGGGGWELLRVWVVCAIVGCFVASECPVNR
jgi:hypothetical protein